MQQAQRVGFRAARVRPAVHTALAGATALAMVGATLALAPQVAAQTPPEKVLQAVQIDVGTDGTLHAVTSTDVRRSKDGDTTSTRRLDPAEHAGGLPVRVTTSWAHDGRVGTDLRDLAGVRGPVRVDITVQNTTAEAQRFRYDAAGVQRDADELVATPLTVVASAVLPKGSFASVTRAPAGTTSANATNGVVSTGEDGTTSVQWASLLAPPRLSGSTTFTLVEDAEDFALADLTLAVQPGLATDASVTRLLGDAFGGSTALVGAENNTIALIARINETLASATDSLQQVRETLTVSANEVGTATAARLDSAAAELDSSAASVRADLQSLDGSVAATLRTTRSDSLSALSGSVTGLLDYLGTPGIGPQPQRARGATDAPVSCEPTPAADGKPAATLLGQLGQVSTLLRRISAESADCVSVIRGSLTRTIGDGESCPVGARDDAPLVCQLRATSVDLAGVAGGLATEGARILGQFDQRAADDVDQRITGLVKAVEGLQGKTKALRGGKADETPVGQLASALEAVAVDVAAAATSLDPAGADGVAAALRELHALALVRAGALRGADSVEQDLVALADQVCTGRGALAEQLQQLLPLVKGDRDATEQVRDSLESLEQYSDGLRARVDAGTCGRLPEAATRTVDLKPEGGGLMARIRTEAGAWDDVAQETDLLAPRPTGAAAEVAALRARLGDLAADVEGALVLLRGERPGGPLSSRGNLASTLDGIVAQVDGLYDPAATGDGCAPATTTSASPLNALARSFTSLTCNQRTTARDLDALLTASLPTYRAAGGTVDRAAGAALAARGAGDEQLGLLLGGLTAQLTGSADLQVRQGDAAVRVLRERLVAQREASARKLDAAASRAVSALAEEISRSVTQQAAASEALQDQLQRVLLDLGSASGGRGLLGVIQDSASQTGVRTEQVVDVSAATSRFRGVRRAVLADAQLERQQVARSLQAASTFPAFALELPAGSTSTGVFVLRVRSVG